MRLTLRDKIEETAYGIVPSLPHVQTTDLLSMHLYKV